MIARIQGSKSLRHVLYYNENKVKDGKAVCIDASGFGMEAKEMGLKDKLVRFQKQVRKNRRVKTNVLHVTLNFEHGEKLSSQKMKAIARDYMEQIGFGDQPFLTYVHKDAGHPHLHIMTTNIRRDGSAINTHNIGATVGMVAREAIEETYGLVKAAGRGGPAYYQGIVAADINKILSGEFKAKPTIANIVRAVLSRYHFTSLEEYNGILRQFNVVADPGEVGSVLRQRGGLLYSAIDEHGKKQGAQIKASAIYVHGYKQLPNHAGLQLLAEKFKRSHYGRKDHRGPLRARIDRLLDQGISLSELAVALHRDKIAMLTRYNVQDQLSGVTFIDNTHGVVFKGSDLGKGFGAAGIAARLVNAEAMVRDLHHQLTAQVLATTDFTKGFAQVLQFWTSRGLALHVRTLPGGKRYFFMGAQGHPTQTLLPAPANMIAYLRANLTVANNLRDRRHDAAARDALLDQYVQGGLLRHTVFEELLTAAAAHAYTPGALLRESRKKRKRKKRSL